MHNDAIVNYAMRSEAHEISQPKSAGKRKRGSVGTGHMKCYYEEMSSVVRSKLAALFITVAEEEAGIERARQSLASNPAFEPYAAFSRIDRENKGYICGREIRDFLIENGYHHLLEAETNYIVKYFDSCPTEHPYNRLDYQE